MKNVKQDNIWTHFRSFEGGNKKTEMIEKENKLELGDDPTLRVSIRTVSKNIQQAILSSAHLKEKKKTMKTSEYHNALSFNPMNNIRIKMKEVVKSYRILRLYYSSIFFKSQ